MKIDYIDFFERVVPGWMRESNKKCRSLVLELNNIGYGLICQSLIFARVMATTTW